MYTPSDLRHPLYRHRFECYSYPETFAYCMKYAMAKGYSFQDAEDASQDFALGEPNFLPIEKEVEVFFNHR